ncbi:MAG: Asp-tRNA(Asn)/Glu-tRNA(Gln) amidotransferase subunit GatC [Candidatus Gracilibacteria bacterium]|nr:Asp-tRNA(Asn)/Glu-tRNA(Gln) amidotransferase subunit GatC [Candidatus Gracilibacteria bacterium]
MLTKEEVEKIAQLSRIEFNSDDIESMRQDLSSILDYIEKLKEIDIEGVEPTTHSLEIKNIFRKDIAKDFSKDLLHLCPEKEGRHVKTKPVF